MSKAGSKLIVCREMLVFTFLLLSTFLFFFYEGNQVSKEIDKATDKVEAVATNEGPKWLNKVNAIVFL